MISMLDIHDICRLYRSSKIFHTLLVSPEAHSVTWKSILQRIWPHLPHPIRTPSFPGFALTLAAPLPYKLESSAWTRRSRKHLTFHDDTTVEFTGTVGEGDRCLVANTVLPKPIQSRTLFRKSWRPVCIPQNGHLRNTTTVYFEITILPSSRPTPGECIAIGVSSALFDGAAKMPGWCVHSFGYHSDDGGIFHGNGHMVRKYGPTFGDGDVVGCGIDYQKGAIFFTKNGNFLQYALEISTKTRWYPTIGLDSHHPVRANFFGPFRFDVASLESRR